MSWRHAKRPGDPRRTGALPFNGDGALFKLRHLPTSRLARRFDSIGCEWSAGTIHSPISSQAPDSAAFEDAGRAHARPHAHGDHAVLQVAAAQGVDGGGGTDRAR